MTARRRVGAVEKGVRADLRTWGMQPTDGGMAAMAILLARTLDEGAGLAVAAVARQLQSALESLCPDGGDGDDEFDRFLADLSTPVRNAED